MGQAVGFPCIRSNLRCTDEEVFPVGETCRGNLLLLMTKENRFYEFTDNCVIKAGESVDEMFDILVGKCKKRTYIC